MLNTQQRSSGMDIFADYESLPKYPTSSPGPHSRLLRLHDEYSDIFPSSGAEIATEFPAISRLVPRSAPGTQEPGLQLTDALLQRITIYNRNLL